jgi:hypothetical protein
MKLKLEYWEKVKDIELKNLVFLDKTGVLLGLRRTHARSKELKLRESNIFIEEKKSQ